MKSKAIHPPGEFPTRVAVRYETVKKIDPSSDLVFEQRLVGMTKAKLVESIDVMTGGKRPEIGHPHFFDPAQAMEQDHRSALAGFDIANALSVN